MEIGLTLEHQLCFALYSASREIQDSYRESLAKLRLTYPQYLAMLVLWEKESATPAELSERLRIGPDTLAPMLRRLEARGAITRRRTRGGGRIAGVELTPKGYELKAYAEQMQGCMERSVSLTSEEIETLRRLSAKVLDSQWAVTLDDLPE